MAPIFCLELPYLSIGIAKVDIFSEPANFSSIFFKKFIYLQKNKDMVTPTEVSGWNPKGKVYIYNGVCIKEEVTDRGRKR